MIESGRPTGRREPALVMRTYRPGDEEAIVALLNQSFPGGWGTMERWRAKHVDRPGFDPEDVSVAESGGSLVGCLHSAVFDMRLEPGVTVRVSVDGDLTVRPDMRGRGVAERLYAFSLERSRERGIVLRCGYTTASPRVHFYRRSLGYVTGFDGTIGYSKLLSSRPVEERILGLFGSSRGVGDPGRGPVVELRILGLPPVRFRLGPDRVASLAPDGRDPVLRIESDQSVLSLFAKGGRGFAGAWGLWGRRSIRVRGIWRGLPRVLAWYWKHGRRLRREGGAGRKERRRGRGPRRYPRF